MWYVLAFGAADVPVTEYLKSEANAKKLSADDNSLDAYCLRGATFSHRDWLIAMRTRWQLCEQWRKLYNEFDVVLCPAMPTPAFPHNHSLDRAARQIEIDSVQVPYFNQYIWASIASLFGLPATAAPIDHTETGLPIGIQIIGDYLEDYTTITFAKLIEREFGGFSPPPRMNNLAH